MNIGNLKRMSQNQIYKELLTC